MPKKKKRVRDGEDDKECLTLEEFNGTPSTDDQSPVSFSEGGRKLRNPDLKSLVHRRELDAVVEFEDPFGDDLEDEEILPTEDASGEEVDEWEDEDEDEQPQPATRVFRPGVDEVEGGEELVCEQKAYDMLHTSRVDWPCLSFDIIPDDLGAGRCKYPHTAYVIAGTQADPHGPSKSGDKVFVMKWHRLNKTKRDRDDDDDSDSDDDDSDSDDDEDGTDEDSALDFRMISHAGVVNRIRCMPQTMAGSIRIAATWSANRKVHMWNIEEHLGRLDSPGPVPSPKLAPLFTFGGHTDEGYALDFNPHKTGWMLSGDCQKYIYLWKPREAGWTVDKGHGFEEHGDSVEDVMWRRAGHSVEHTFASCSVDKSIRVWDIREKQRRSAQQIIDAHASDVNVISWNPIAGDLLLSGSDDGSFKVWDTRYLSAGEMANFSWHKKAITSVDWHPTDEACLAVSSDDNSVSIWDMSVEDRGHDAAAPEGADHFPPQLLFLHLGQKHIKEVKWHPQIPGVCISTAEDGFNIFRPCNL